MRVFKKDFIVKVLYVELKIASFNNFPPSKYESVNI